MLTSFFCFLIVVNFQTFPTLNVWKALKKQ